MPELNPEIAQSLRSKQRFAESRGRSVNIRVPNILYPRRYEIEMTSFYRKRINMLRSMVIERVSNNLKGILTDDLIDQGRNDDLSDELTRIFLQIRENFERANTDTALRTAIAAIGLSVSNFGLRQLRKAIRQSIAVDPFIGQPYLQSQIKQYVTQNVTLIKNIEGRYLSEIEEIVFRGARRGTSTKEIASQISKRARVSMARAKLIARDQINKFNGQLNRLRQEELGVKRYRWITAQDENVRTTHQALQGRVFKWSDPPEVGHPGEDINCRCHAEPHFDDLLGK